MFDGARPELDEGLAMSGRLGIWRRSSLSLTGGEGRCAQYP